MKARNTAGGRGVKSLLSGPELSKVGEKLRNCAVVIKEMINTENEKAPLYAVFTSSRRGYSSITPF